MTMIMINYLDNEDNVTIEQVFSPRVYTSQGVPISVTGIAQVYQIGVLVYQTGIREGGIWSGEKSPFPVAYISKADFEHLYY